MSGGIFNPPGIEPSTHHVSGDRAVRELGEMICLDHDESRSYEVMLRVLDGAEEIATAEARVTSIARQPSDGFPQPSGRFPTLGGRAR